MNKKYHRGFFAERYLDDLEDSQQNNTNARSCFIEDLDFFERERLNIIREFGTENLGADADLPGQRNEMC
ncbi:MAG: hypothetical protein HQM16_05860 [Deltaproteobacteria bacterium]|nr:hypothetical protein [Deltaproteobacteria bacterium]